MPKASPFTGLLFDPERAGPLERVTAPPYDMITTDEERRFHAASPHNVVRLILGRVEDAGDHADQYTKAPGYLRRWQEEGVLVETPGPSWFPYEMTFHFQGRARRVRGVICAVEVEAWGGAIVPHERTLAAPIADRLRLLRSARANLSPVYGVVAGPIPGLGRSLDRATRGTPDRRVVDEEGVEHRMWVVDADGGGALGAGLDGERLMIADGHHRYTTALAYREEMRRRHGSGPWDRMMMLVVDAGSEDPPVLPIHRVVQAGHLEGATDGPLVRDLAEVLATIRDEDLTVGVAERLDGEVVHRVTRLRGTPPTVCALHEEVLGGAELRFTPDAVAAEEAVRAGEARAAFFLPPTRVEAVRAVIERGERLPEKSTHFWPKPRTGMVIRPLR